MPIPILSPIQYSWKSVGQLAQDLAATLVIVPFWQTQPWFPQFLRLMKPGTTPVFIPAHQHLFQLPGTNLQHPIWDQLILVAAILSGTSQSSSWFLGYIVWISARSARSAIVEITGVPQLEQTWLVSRFMKETFHLKPPQPRYNKTWDVNKVMYYLKSLGPNDSLSLKQLKQQQPCWQS